MTCTEKAKEDTQKESERKKEREIPIGRLTLAQQDTGCVCGLRNFQAFDFFGGFY